MPYFKRYLLLTFCIFTAIVSSGQAGQKTIGRVEQMPNEPQPFLIRDWAEVARGYDELVYDLDATGDYLPLIFLYDDAINYPGQKSFGLDSYVGTFSNNNGEAINVLPSIIGATLVGIDKSDQNGHNWVLYSQDYFNKDNGELIYLNGRNSSSGGDWWYDMMPNIYFYQLYDLYGNIGDAENQFHTVAGRFAGAVRGLGGGDTPWTRANMNHRAWDFVEMKPNDTSVPEPEAAGSFAWVLYHAYNQTGEMEYLKTAEWSMEFLSNLAANPSYELQLPYGAYTAAKMNAELGTKYQLDKMLFWIFNRGPLRGWGTVVDNWGGIDVSGLVGEANENGNDYVFQMNAVQQAAALVPMVRYDKQYARAIGKWILNVANATRFMFPGFLPAAQQDASEWSQEYDPNAVMGYEAMREMLNGFSPFSTGDALVNGWAETNLALYGTSSIGYLGSMISPTDIEKILLIDVLKTDFFKDDSYPTYLLYNPLPTDQQVSLEVGPDAVDIYDALTEEFVLGDVSGTVAVNIPADQARLLVYAPAGGEQQYIDNKFLIDGVVVDYWQNSQPYNFHPRIQSVAVINHVVEFGDTIDIFSAAIDFETKDLEYLWTPTHGEIPDSGKVVRYVAPEVEVEDQIRLIVVDEADQRDTFFIAIQALAEVNIAPEIIEFKPNKKHTKPDEQIILQCEAIDLNGDPLEYQWSSQNGQIIGAGSTVSWQAPAQEGIETISILVLDDAGGSTQSSIEILVKDFSQLPAANLIAHYPFSGNAMDISGNELHGQVFGAKLTQDFDGNDLAAYFFDGVNDRISVPNETILNFRDGVTLSMMVQPTFVFPRESFILSHGSWQNRYKISIIPEGKLRWTLKSANGSVVDLDSEVQIQKDSVYHIATTYDGEHVIIFINGRVESFRVKSGEINESPVELLLGQILPDDTGYNFQGNVDDVRIYDMALSPSQIAGLAGVSSGIESIGRESERASLVRLFPNPVAGDLHIYPLAEAGTEEIAQLRLYNQQGNVVWKNILQGPGKVNLEGLPFGAYHLYIEKEGKFQIETIIIQ